MLKEHTTIESVDDTSDTSVQHSDKHITQDKSAAITDDDEGDVQTAIKSKRTESMVIKDHPIDAIIRDITDGRRTRGKRNINYPEMAEMISMTCYTSITEPKNIKEAIIDEY